MKFFAVERLTFWPLGQKVSLSSFKCCCIYYLNPRRDERDVIFISIGYGKTEHGKLPLNFGPLNREGGERRLNVLITRARLAMEVFCNFTADELETSSLSPLGLVTLKTFLKYAKDGELKSIIETGKPTDSPFEDEVIKEIMTVRYLYQSQEVCNFSE